MISYELAQELQTAGFPQEGHEHYWCVDTAEYDKPEYHVVNAPNARVGSDRCPAIPTLEELIEACGEKFWNLHIKREGGIYPWIAAAVDPVVGSGSTPTEAVARLWLALNKHEA